MSKKTFRAYKVEQLDSSLRREFSFKRRFICFDLITSFYKRFVWLNGGGITIKTNTEFAIQVNPKVIDKYQLQRMVSVG